MLNERDLLFVSDLPQTIERERRSLMQEDRWLRLELSYAHDPEDIARRQQALEDNRRKLADVDEAIREWAPRFADLHDISTVTLSNLKRSLRPGTAVLSYHLTEEEARVFVVSPDGDLSVVPIRYGAGRLSNDVIRLRRLLDAGRWDTVPDEPLLKLAGKLYDALVLPVESTIEDAERLLIVPHRSLNLLPFAALRRSTDDGSMYLAEWKPSFTANSLTVYSQLQSSGGGSDTARLAAFGNPDYSQALQPPSAGFAVQVRNEQLSELPWSETEVTRIAEIFGPRADVHIGTDATEIRAKAIGSDARYVHFAAHALLNERQPMDTAIALTTPGERSTDDDGFLQVWEVYEGLRLKADLVVLSACETALGTGYRGEGLIGLTRAFQYAGAASVLASLWQVNDRSTSQLMAEFYTRLDAGMPMEDALREAQLAMIRGSDQDRRPWWRSVRDWFAKEASVTHAHPYHWSGFVLNGAGQK